MVVESILDPHKAEKKPWVVFFISIIFTILSIFVSHIIFPSQVSILTIAFITILFTPFFNHLFNIEEKKEEEEAEGKIKEGIFQRHEQVIKIFSYFFFGIIVVMTFVFIFFPSFSQNLFSLQAQTLRQISGATGKITIPSDFFTIFFNNTKVMSLIFLTSVLFGAGAVFILAWNASVISVFVGMFIQNLAKSGIPLHAAYLFGLPLGLSRLVIHGVPEVLGYFLVGIAGGILSVAIAREKYNTPEFKQVIKDSLLFFISAECLILVGALLEVFV